jgi:hypothetical protein
MPLTKLKFKPGINRETTSYDNEGGWFDMDKVRFRFGVAEKIGGWVKRSAPDSFLGACRALHSWSTLASAKLLGVGTSQKYYIDEGGVFYDITPIRRTTAAGGVIFSATNSSTIITATDAGHGCVSGDFVTFSGALTLGGNISAAVLNQEYKIDSIPTGNTYTFVARTVQSLKQITVNGQYTPTPVTATAGDNGSGGGATKGAYQLSVGLDTSVFSNGWGAGVWNVQASPAGSVLTSTLRLWSHDNFGEDLLFNVRNGGIFYYDSSLGLGSRGVNLSSLAGANSVPTIAKQILISDTNRHILAFGCDTEAAPGAQDPLAIRFSSQESLTDWQTQSTNTAGELRISSGSEIVAAIETRREVVVFTDRALYSMQFLGAPEVFGITSISENTTIAGPNAVVAVQDNLFWMGESEFYGYGGSVQRIPCLVRDKVFDDFNRGQSEKVTAALNAQSSEVWWFYASLNSETNDKYVVYNYVESVWSYGDLARTAWVDRAIFSTPLAAGTDGFLYEHEQGFDDGSTTPATAINAYIESSEIDLGEGDQFAFIKRLIPDITFVNSSNPTPSANFIVQTRNFPGGNFTDTSNSSVVKTASVPVEQFTKQINIRLRGRSFALKIQSDGLGVGWRLGAPRVDIRPDGRR